MSLLTPAETPFVIDGPAGALEMLTMPPRAGHAEALAVICHPHSLMGGSMHNKVVHTLARTHRDAGHLAVRFNFRGVGQSAGSFDAGAGEVEDLLRAVQWGRDTQPAGRFFLSGFSFGSYVAARAMERLGDAGFVPDHLLLVAPPVHHFGFSSLLEFPCPVTVIMGEEDEVVPPADVYAWCDRITSSNTLIKVPGATHFFHGRLNDLKALVEPIIK